MVLDLDNIGFPINGVHTYWWLHLQLLERGHIVNTPAGVYRWLAPGEGIEVWAMQQADNKLGHLHAHFSGGARIRVALVEHHLNDSSLAEGYFVAYFKHKENEGIESVHKKLRYGDGTYTGVIPFVFAAPDYNCYDGLQIPLVTDVQLTAFSSKVTAYETEDEWVDYQLEEEKRKKGEDEPEDEDGGFMAGASFLPDTMFSDSSDPDNSLNPMAQLSGIVLETAIITNPLSEEDFSWARIETAAGEMDLVVSPENLNGYLVEGGVAAGLCLLSGRLPEFAAEIEDDIVRLPTSPNVKLCS